MAAFGGVAPAGREIVRCVTLRKGLLRRTCGPRQVVLAVRLRISNVSNPAMRSIIIIGAPELVRHLVRTGKENIVAFSSLTELDRWREAQLGDERAARSR